MRIAKVVYRHDAKGRHYQHTIIMPYIMVKFPVVFN